MPSPLVAVYNFNMRRAIFSILTVLWWTWLGVQILKTGSTQVALELRDRFLFASTETWKFAESLYSIGLLFIAAISAWSDIFAPFLADLIGFIDDIVFPKILYIAELVCPVLLRGWEICRPWIAAGTQYLVDFFIKLPFELQASLIWIPGVLALSRFDRRALHGLLLSIAWTTWKVFGATIGTSREPLVVACVWLPIYLSLSNFRASQKKQRLLSLNSYWTLFPAFLWIENSVSLNAGIYVSTLTVATVWLFFNDGYTVILDCAYSLSWKFFGDELVDILGRTAEVARILNEKYGATYPSVAIMTTVIDKIKSLKDMKNSYKVAVFILTGVALLYWAFAVMNKIFALAVWPWFFWEMAKVSVHRSEPFYRGSLAFALFFLGLEYIMLPKSPYIISAFISLFHLPIVFVGKMGAEVALDAVIKSVSSLFTRTIASRQRHGNETLPALSESEKDVKTIKVD